VGLQMGDVGSASPERAGRGAASSRSEDACAVQPREEGRHAAVRVRRGGSDHDRRSRARRPRERQELGQEDQADQAPLRRRGGRGAGSGSRARSVSSRLPTIGWIGRSDAQPRRCQRDGIGMDGGGSDPRAAHPKTVLLLQVRTSSMSIHYSPSFRILRSASTAAWRTSGSSSSISLVRTGTASLAAGPISLITSTAWQRTGRR